VQLRLATLILVLAAATLGCGRRDGLTRFKISGTVTYAGKPVGGMVRFVPDGDKGNRGPATMVQVAAGQYRSADGYGVLGGPYRVEISGYEPLTPEQEKAGVSPKPLFEGYKVSVDLDKKDSVMNFEVPTQKERR
jgi:hypothetical protein